MIRRNLGEERIILAYTLRSHSITDIVKAETTSEGVRRLWVMCMQYSWRPEEGTGFPLEQDLAAAARWVLAIKSRPSVKPSLQLPRDNTEPHYRKYP